MVIASVYCPPRFTISADQYEEFYKSLGTRFLAAGDYNAKHTYWGSRLITPRGRTLFNTITKMGLDVISSGEPTYWPSDRQKIPDVIDFGVTKNISRELVDVEASLDLSSDHSPTIVSIRIPQRYEQPFTNMNVISHTNWLRFKKYLSSHCSESIRLRTPGDIELGIENISKMMNEAVHHASTTYQQPSFNRIFSADIQRLVSEKRRARREWQQHRSPQHKARLRECITQLRNLLASEKTASFKEYLENLDATSETNYSLWRAARNLKRPVQFKPPYAIQVEIGHEAIVKKVTCLLTT
ncbi:Probable RNA-directed DNA polymerase from transposon X-element [Eumeta japonica]|uniref:Probable RNA-directed DNA polymerase from transposon X-element n=1 Tax=Eumeta variegata TaxID=151549 RepID=A0A4C1TP08_EUMVA|nr:Probable RNA-directed DNA polymerase from transposon X-element [Eumeta japonica]